MAVRGRAACILGACAAGLHRDDVHVDGGAAPVLLLVAPARHEQPADAMLSTHLYSIVVAATTLGTSSGLMRKRSCVVARHGGAILSCAGWMDAAGDSARAWWCMWLRRD